MPNDDVVEIFKYSEFLLVSDGFRQTEIYRQPFGNLELISSHKRSLSYPRLIQNFPPGTGSSIIYVGNGTLKIELESTDRTGNIFSLSEKYTGGSEDYLTTFTPDGLYAIVQPLSGEHLVVIGKLPVIKSKTEIRAIVKETIRKRKGFYPPHNFKKE